VTRGTAAKEYLHRIFPLELARHEYDRERFIPIPEEILEIYSTWRPTPLVRAKRLERVLNTPARIYYKNEAVSPPGSHKANAAIAQAYYAKSQGIKRLVTSTTAGQWGSALAFACTFFDLECTVYMPRVNCQQKPYRKNLIDLFSSSSMFPQTIRSPSMFSVMSPFFTLVSRRLGKVPLGTLLELTGTD